MTDGGRDTQAVEAPLGSLGALMGGDSPDSRTFLRGLMLGAIVGAAIAGSRIWSQRRTGDAPSERPRRTTVPDGSTPKGG